jgi:hypothetical protein
MWECDSPAQTTAAAHGIHTPPYLYGAAGSSNVTAAASGASFAAVAPFALHVEDSFLYPLNYLHAGALNFWSVMHPHDDECLERRLREALHRPTAGSSRDGGSGGGDSGGGGRDATTVRPPRTCSQFMPSTCSTAGTSALHARRAARRRARRDGAQRVPPGLERGWNVAEAINYGDARSAHERLS